MASEPERILRLTMLLHDTGKPLCQTRTPDGVFHYHGHAAPGAVVARQVLERLKYDKATERTVIQLVKNHSLYPELF